MVLGKGVKREIGVNFDLNLTNGTAPASSQFQGAPLANVPFGFAGYKATGPAYGLAAGYGKGFASYCPITGACGSLNMGGFEPTTFGGFAETPSSRMFNRTGSML